jgi:L-threonylcarbamoyladenylate synthase
MSRHSTTRVLSADPDDPDPAALDEAARVLSRGGLVAFATETVYGLGAVATNPEAVSRIYAAKGRPAVNPLILHVAGIDQAREYVSDWPGDAEELASRFWPGPLTLVLTRTPKIPDLVTAGKPSVGVRAPAGNVARGLIERCGQPLAAPSANRSNRLSPTRAEHVVADLDGLIDLVVDSGRTSLGLESTVLDLTCAPPRLLRPGPITISDLESALSGRPIQLPSAGETSDRPSSPGQFTIHYSPRTPSFRVDSRDELRRVPKLEAIALLGFLEDDLPPEHPAALRSRLDTPARAGRLLYDVLHGFDVLNPTAIIVIMPPDRPEWLAVRDRLLRATRPLAACDWPSSESHP